jgi:xanthine dehydrogenase YagS FAD-binding subunit
MDVLSHKMLGDFRRRLSKRHSSSFITVYREMPAVQQPFRLLSLLMDIDETLTFWRYRHALMVERCLYIYDTSTPCNKREPGGGCSAIGGINRMHAILGTSEQCIATHPSDMCVALAALEARVRAIGPGGERTIAFADLHRLPADTPHIDSNLRADEIITAVELPPKGFARNYTYLKIRDRLSYAFALVSVAVGLGLEDGTIKEARLALGGVAHKPWRDHEAEAQLAGAPATRESFERAADTVLREARGFGHNNFKIKLARRAIVRALAQAARGEAQVQADKRISGSVS